VTEVWDRFSDDPRTPHNAVLRAADADRDVVQEVLAEAYADGRLAPEEHAERTERLLSSRTLGDLVPLLDGLVRRPSADLPVQAEERYRRELREAALSFATVNAICWGVWAITGANGWPFVWPWFVTLFTAINLARVRLTKASRIESRVRKLEKRQQTELPPIDDSPRDGTDHDV
jgi:hypothetical protein